MNRCCLCNAEFSPSFRGAGFIRNQKDARLCLKCANDVRILTRFDAPNQDVYEEAFYHLHKKLLVNKYPDDIAKMLFDILKDVTTYGAYLEQKKKKMQS